MIATIAVKVNAAKPNFPLQPMFAFMGSPSSLRILDVPKSIGNWSITGVKVAVAYPDNTTIEKSAVRSGSVWVATVEGCDVAGKVSNGYEVIADGKDEDGNDVTGYVLGKGDVYIIEDSIDISRLLDKITVRYVEDIPDVPTKGDLMNSNGELRLFDGIDWIVISTGGNNGVYDSQITIQKNGTSVGSFTVNASEPKTINIPVPSRTSDIENDSDFITSSAVAASYYNKGEIDTSLAGKRGIHDNEIHPTSVTDTPFYKVRVDYSDISQEKMTVVLEKQNGSQMVWLWQDNGQEIELTYSDGYFQLSYQNITDLNNTPHSSFFGDFEITNPDESVTIGDSYFRFNLSTYGGTYASQEWVEADVVSLIPSNISSFNNDVGFITASAIPSNVGAFTNDVGYLTSVSWGDVQDKPDVALMSDIPSNVSELENDAGYITVSAIPSNISSFNNDAGYITASAIPSSYSSISDANGNVITASGAVTWHTPGKNHWKMRFDGVDYSMSGTKTDSYADISEVTRYRLQFNGTDTWTLVERYYDVDQGTWTTVGDWEQSGDETATSLDFSVATTTWMQEQVAYNDTLATQSQLAAKRDKTDLTYEQSFDKNHLEGIVSFNIVDTSAPLTTIVLDKYDAASQTWSGDTQDWKVMWYYAGMGEDVMFQLYHNNIGVQAFQAPAQGAGTTSWEFYGGGSPVVSGTLTMNMSDILMTTNPVKALIDSETKDKRDYNDISYYATPTTYSAYTYGIDKFTIETGWSNIWSADTSSAQVSGSTTTWALNNGLGVLTSDGQTFSLELSGSTIGTSFTMDDLKNGGVIQTTTIDSELPYQVTANAQFFKTTFALKDYVDQQIASQIGAVLSESF